jgi:hypothetical protein
MLSVLDAAVAAAETAGDKEGLAGIAALWKEVNAGWKTSVAGQWEGLADMLIEAVQGERNSAALLRSKPGFANSYCSQLLDKRGLQTPLGPPPQ